MDEKKKMLGEQKSYIIWLMVWLLLYYCTL